jgi:hypothetical protein
LLRSRSWQGRPPSRCREPAPAVRGATVATPSDCVAGEAARPACRVRLLRGMPGAFCTARRNAGSVPISSRSHARASAASPCAAAGSDPEREVRCRPWIARLLRGARGDRQGRPIRGCRADTAACSRPARLPGERRLRHPVAKGSLPSVPPRPLGARPRAEPIQAPAARGPKARRLRVGRGLQQHQRDRRAFSR